MSVKEPIEVQSVVLTTRADGARLLTISSRAGQFEFEFNHAAWLKLSDSALWFGAKALSKAPTK